MILIKVFERCTNDGGAGESTTDTIYNTLNDARRAYILHHDTQIQMCIYSFRKYAWDKWCSFIQTLAWPIQYSCTLHALHSPFDLGTFSRHLSASSTNKDYADIVLIRIFCWAFFLYVKRCFGNWSFNGHALYQLSLSHMLNAHLILIQILACAYRRLNCAFGRNPWWCIRK